MLRTSQKTSQLFHLLEIVYPSQCESRCIYIITKKGSDINIKYLGNNKFFPVLIWKAKTQAKLLVFSKTKKISLSLSLSEYPSHIIEIVGHVSITQPRRLAEAIKLFSLQENENIDIDTILKIQLEKRIEKILQELNIQCIRASCKELLTKGLDFIGIAVEAIYTCKPI